MNISFTARHFNASARLQGYATETVKKLEKFFDGLMDCSILLEPTQSPDEPQRAELTVTIPGTQLIASESATTYEQAVLKAVDNMKRQIVKYKEKHFQH